MCYLEFTECNIVAKFNCLDVLSSHTDIDTKNCNTFYPNEIYIYTQTSCDTIITKVTQNNTGIYTKESSQQTFEIPKNNLNVRFEWAYQNHNNEILQIRKNKISHNL